MNTVHQYGLKCIVSEIIHDFGKATPLVHSQLRMPHGAHQTAAVQQ